MEVLAQHNRQGQFTILYRALTEFKSGTFTDMLNEITKKGFTLFAPTDEAFLALPAKFHTFPMSENAKRAIFKILRYHVVGRSVRTDQLRQDGTLLTNLGKLLRIKPHPGVGVVIGNDNAKIVQANIRAANGVIQAIDKVLMP
jgi:uncharacterized surface protein with fasciclin (FAS1) repeats